MGRQTSALKKPPVFSGMGARRAIITFHSLGDLDAVGAAIAVQRFIGKKAVIAPPDRPSSPARRLLEYTGTKTTLFSEVKCTKKDFLIVLDSSSPHLLPHLSGMEPDLMIDHHTRFGGEVTAKKSIADPAASSACEMLHFLLKPGDRVSCIALLLGLISDSGNFKYATPRTFEAAGVLLSKCGMSYSTLVQLATAPESFTERMEAVRSCQSVKAEKIGEHIVATAFAKSHEAHFADMLVHMGADIAFVACEGEDGRISGRMRDSLRGHVRLEKIMFEVGKVLGGSGSGHEMAAGASGGRENIRPALGICVKLAEQQLLSSESGKVKEIKW